MILVSIPPLSVSSAHGTPCYTILEFKKNALFACSQIIPAELEDASAGKHPQTWCGPTKTQSN